MAEVTVNNLLARMNCSIIYHRDDIFDLFHSADEEKRCEILETLGDAISSGRIVQTYARGRLSYVKESKSVIDEIDAKEREPRKTRELDMRRYEGYESDLGSHRELAMLARGGQ